MYSLIKRHARFISMLVLLSFMVGLFPLTNPAAALAVQTEWADESSHYRMKLEIDNSGLTSALVDFPVLVKLNGARINYSAADGTFLHFYNADQKVELPYEVEHWNPEGDSFIWVKIPLIKAEPNSENVFWLYYGAAGEAPQNGQHVWDDNYLMVQHMEENAGNVVDSTYHAYSGSPIKEPSYGVPGLVGNAIHFQGGSYIKTNFNYNSSITDMTVEAIVSIGKYGDMAFVVQRDSTAGIPAPRWIMVESGNREFFFTAGVGGTRVYSGFKAQIGKIYHVAIVYDKANAHYQWYVDGQPYKSGNVSPLNPSTAEWLFGVNKSLTANELNGDIDEVRVSNTMRSADWIRSTYRSVNDSLLRYGNIETPTGSVVMTKIALTPSSHSLNTGETVQLAAASTFSDNTTSNVTKAVNWESNDTTVVNVVYGNVTALKTGTATITATFGSVKGTSIIKVQSPADKPVLVEPADGSVDVSRRALLKVRATDPSDDPMKVTFYHHKPTTAANLGSNAANKAYENTVSMSYPATASSSTDVELPFALYSDLAKSDDKRYATSSPMNAPYQRFDLHLEEDPASVSEIEVTWEGKSNQPVTMFAWNYEAAQWVTIAFQTSASVSDALLKASVNPVTMVQDRTVKLLVGSTQQNVTLPGKIPNRSEYDYTLAWISDTQYYSEKYPNIYNTMNQWIVDNREAMNIKYVLHTGDIVDNWDQEIQWQRADRAMKILDDANMPYGVVAGNHDVAFDAGDYKDYVRYFGKSRFEGRSYYGGQRDDNRDHYDLIEANGDKYIIVYLGWQIKADSIAWANQVLQEHADRKAILAMHAYIDSKGRDGTVKYGMEGMQVREQVVAPNSNVFMVLSGHYHGAIHNVKRINGKVVFEVLADYQNGPEGGSGYIRLLHIDLQNQQIYMNSYSPYLNDYNYFVEEKDQFTIPLQTDKGNIEMSTDYVGVQLYKDEAIGEVHDVPSGSEAAVTWGGLEGNKTYQWFTVAEDTFGNATRSDIWQFTTSEFPSLQLRGLHPMSAGKSLQTVTKFVYDEETSLNLTSNVRFTSSNGVVAVVNESGVVTALQAGESVISAVYEDLLAQYTLTVRPTSSAPLRSDASLIALQVSHSPIHFSADNTEYRVSVANSVSNITVTAVAQDRQVSITINGEAVSQKQINLSDGLNTILVKVTAEDGTTEKIYKLFVTRASRTVTNTPVQGSTEPLSLHIPMGWND